MYDEDGRFFCDPLQIWFPPIYRVEQTVTQEHLDEIGIVKEKPGVFTNYTFNPLFGRVVMRPSWPKRRAPKPGTRDQAKRPNLGRRYS